MHKIRSPLDFILKTLFLELRVKCVQLYRTYSILNVHTRPRLFQFKIETEQVREIREIRNFQRN